MNRQATTRDKAQRWEVLKPLLDAMYGEFKELSKKKPEAVLSKQKVAVVNRLLESCRKVLESEPSIEFLDLLSEDDVPQNSDVVLALSQYIGGMKSFEAGHKEWSAGELVWVVK